MVSNLLSFILLSFKNAWMILFIFYLYNHCCILLTCLNTNLHERERKLWTYTYANNTKAQIDYIFMNKKWNNSTLNFEACSSFEGVSSDHRIVTAKIRLSLQRKTTRTTTFVHYDWSLLNNKDSKNEYALTLRNKFDAL